MPLPRGRRAGAPRRQGTRPRRLPDPGPRGSPNALPTNAPPCVAHALTAPQCARPQPPTTPDRGSPGTCPSWSWHCRPSWLAWSSRWSRCGSPAGPRRASSSRSRTPSLPSSRTMRTATTWRRCPCTSLRTRTCRCAYAPRPPAHPSPARLPAHPLLSISPKQTTFENLCRPALVVDPLSRCAAALIYGAHLVVLPFRLDTAAAPLAATEAADGAANPAGYIQRFLCARPPAPAY